jgi:hypothetical protein
METIKKMKIDYIAPECNVISIKLDTLMQMIISSKEVGGQGAKRGSTWDNDDDSEENDNENIWDE